MGCNPFMYINEPGDILILADVLYFYSNHNPPDVNTHHELFFDQVALLWLRSAMGYLWCEAPPEEQNIPMLLEILEADDVREDNESYENAVDGLFAELEERNSNCFAVKWRKKYKIAIGKGKVMESVLIAVKNYLSLFDIPEVAELVPYAISHTEWRLFVFSNKLGRGE